MWCVLRRYWTKEEEPSSGWLESLVVVASRSHWDIFFSFWLTSSNTHKVFSSSFPLQTSCGWATGVVTNQPTKRESLSSCLIFFFCTAPLWCCSHSFLFLSILSGEIFSYICNAKHPHFLTISRLLRWGAHSPKRRRALGSQRDAATSFSLSLESLSDSEIIFFFFYVYCTRDCFLVSLFLGFLFDARVYRDGDFDCPKKKRRLIPSFLPVAIETKY